MTTHALTTSQLVGLVAVSAVVGFVILSVVSLLLVEWWISRQETRSRR